MAIQIIRPGSAPTANPNQSYDTPSQPYDELDLKAISGMPPGAEEDFGINSAREGPTLPKPSIQVVPRVVRQDAYTGREYSATPQTLDMQIGAGRLALMAAENIEEVYGIEAAAPTYIKAKDHLLRAVGLEDARRPIDVALWLQTGTCLSKLVNTTLADEKYAAPESAEVRKGDAWKKAAENTFATASAATFGEEMSNAAVAATAIVAAEGLGSINSNDKAKDVLSEASRLLKKNDADPAEQLTHIVESHAELPADEVVTEELQDVAHALIIDLTTKSHSLVDLAA